MVLRNTGALRVTVSIVVGIGLGAFAVAVGGLTAPVAQAQRAGCSASVAIANPGFEDPDIQGQPQEVTSLPGWNVSGIVWLNAGGSQSVTLGGNQSFFWGTISQSLDGASLAGETVTFQIVAPEGHGNVPLAIALGDQSVAVTATNPLAEEVFIVTFEVPDSIPDALLLSLSANDSFIVDVISGIHTTECQPVTIADCQNGGWADYGFKNQGQCIRLLNTGQDSR